MITLSLILMVACAYINHLGGQSTVIPFPRITCRVVGIPLAVFIASLLYGLTTDDALVLLLVYLPGMALWAVFKWGPMFMAINGTDCRDYAKRWWLPNFWITRATDMIMGVSQMTRLTCSQCREWGMVYGTLRGGMQYPLYMGLALIFSPLALFIGAVSFLQGIIYYNSKDVLHAEYIEGALIGLAASLIIVM